jgi:hypothetical protein
MKTLLHEIEAFVAEHRALADVYAFAVVVGDAGGVTLALADEASTEAKLAARYPDVRPRWEEQFWGTRWNPADFGTLLDLEVVTGEEAGDPELAFQALAEADFGELQTTDDFVAFVARFDQSEAERKEWMRRTIDEVTFARIFPDLVAFERYLADTSASPPAEQARFWAAAMEELALQTNTPRTAALRQMGRTQYDAHDALVALGDVAVEPLLQIVERYALHPPFTEPGSLAHRLHGALSGESKLATAAMFGLREIGTVDDSVVVRLREVLGELVAAYPPDGTVGVAAAVAARVLYALRPDQFDAPEIDPDTNRLINHESFCES